MFKDTITILIPSFKPDYHLFKVCEELFSSFKQILIIDDGSGEEYKDVFNKVNEFAKVIHLDVNKGKGVALKEGFKQVLSYFPNTKFVVSVDGDGQHKLNDIIRIASFAIEKNEFVLGMRDFKGKIPLRSRVGNDMSKFVQTNITYRYLKDNQCGLRAIPIELLPYLIKIKGNKYEYEMNVISSMLLRNIPFSTLLIDTVFEDKNPTSHFRPLRDTIFIQKDLFKYGLINIIFYLLPMSLFYVFQQFIFASSSTLALELSVIIPSMIFIFIGGLFSVILFKPHNAINVLARQMFYKIILLSITILLIHLFTCTLHANIYLIYVLSGLIGVIPIFFLCKLSSK